MNAAQDGGEGGVARISSVIASWSGKAALKHALLQLKL